MRPNSRSSWSAWMRCAVSAETRSGRSPAMAHRMSTSWVARSTVTPTSRMRAGNGPARRLEIAKTVDSQPASSRRPSSRIAGLKRSMWPTWTGGAPRRRGRGHDLVGFGRCRGERLLDEDGDPALDRCERERQVAGRRSRDDDRVEVGLGQHRHRLVVRLRAGVGAGRARGRSGPGRRPRPAGRRRSSRQDAQVVPAHRPKADQPDAQLAVADREPRRRSSAQRAARSPACASRRSTAAAHGRR